MNFATLKVEMHEHVAHVQLNRPDAMNTLDQAMVDELYACFRELDSERNVRVVVLSGAGRTFCAGGDVSFLKVISSQTNPETRQHLGELFRKLTFLTRVEKPIIAALHGFVLGAGFGLSLLCDLRLAAESTKFGAEFPMMGIIPELGFTHMFPRLVGLGKAMELVLTARRFDADEAERIGMVNKVVADDKLMDDAMDLAHHMASLPPLALGLGKTALRKGASKSLEESIQLEANINALCYHTEDHKEAANAFLEKRKPIFWKPRPDR